MAISGMVSLSKIAIASSMVFSINGIRSLISSKTEVILNKNSFFGDKLTYIETDPKKYANIDTMEDWNSAEQLLLSE